MGSRKEHRKSKPYPSDLTDAKWELIAPMVPVPSAGRPSIHSRCRIVDAILYVNRTGCSWRQLPHDFPKWETVYWDFKVWNESGVTDRIYDALRARARDRGGRIRWPRRGWSTLRRSRVPTPSGRTRAVGTARNESMGAKGTW
ncbi:hypothetical protein C5613_43720 [Rhodococcus opacus]|uniref:Insertion element IS402-like domain-containing protein n=1 Tax=Rhodococcus opacus TaxID=37919 RepID=A0A2S8I8X7_RHOOP|nr:hypothetical protein C5613_43720 [Rhodococcus opacus]